MDTNLGQVVLVQDINPGVSNSTYPTEFDENLDVVGEGEDVLPVAEDGSSDSFSSIPRPNPSGSPTPDSSFPSGLVEFNDRLYFNANDGENGSELFVSDGTDKGTQLVTDLRPGASNYGYAYSSFPYSLVEFQDKLYFTANVADNGNELFVSDGTAEGTQLLVDLYPGNDNYGNVASSYPNNLVELNDQLYFSANDGENGNELFVSDGTGSGTELLVDLYPGENKYGGINGSYPSNLVGLKDKLYSTANDGKNGNELYVSDGTAEGTQLLVDLYPGENNYGNNGSYINGLVEFNDQLYFSADDGENGRELFVSDGTGSGTELLVDLYPGESKYGNINGSDPNGFVEFNDKLYFSANDGIHGHELFVSDGTASGTQLVADINQGTSNYGGYGYGSSPSNLVEFNDKLYFTANNGENGNELYVSDGTASGTQLVADIYPGSDNYGSAAGSYPSSLTVFGDELFFAANNGETGTELYKLTLDASTGEPQVLITGSDGADNLSGTDSAEEIQALSGQDTVNGGLGNDTIDGGDGDDRLNGNAGNDSVIGGSGNDILDGNAGNDILNGSNGSDVLNGGGSSDSLAGGEDNDILNGGNGVDTLSGDNGDDRLKGNSGGDSLAGGSGNDFLEGGFGFDTLNGGDGDDVFALRSGGGTDTILDFSLGSDRLSLANSLQFADLNFADNNILLGEEVLATLDGINTEQLTVDNFS
jgi:ELWxxDGT repeat protein